MFMNQRIFYAGINLIRFSLETAVTVIDKRSL